MKTSVVQKVRFVCALIGFLIPYEPAHAWKSAAALSYQIFDPPETSPEKVKGSGTTFGILKDMGSGVTLGWKSYIVGAKGSGRSYYGLETGPYLEYRLPFSFALWSGAGWMRSSMEDTMQEERQAVRYRGPCFWVGWLRRIVINENVELSWSTGLVARSLKQVSRDALSSQNQMGTAREPLKESHQPGFRKGMVAEWGVVIQI